MRVVLTPIEKSMAAHVGSMRRIASERDGRNANVHASISNWCTDIEGAAYEMAFAKALSAYWGGTINSFKLVDVGKFQVRGSEHLDGHLIFRQNDNIADTYIFVTGAKGEYLICGMISGSEAKQPKYYRGADARGVGAWWVPQSALRQIAFGKVAS